MGRRILPKLDPTVDYSRHLLEWDDVALPFAVQTLFDQPRPLEVEIGCGKGLFLSNQSGLVPARNFLGVEIAKKYARFSAYRLARLGRVNARVLRGDGLAFVRDGLPDESLVALHIYYPDPWWKARHRKRRVVSPVLAQQAQRTLAPGGQLHFWTDVEEYFEEGCTALRAAGTWQEQLDAISAAAESDTDEGLTHFDRRMIRHQHDIFRACFTKSA